MTKIEGRGIGGYSVYQSNRGLYYIILGEPRKTDGFLGYTATKVGVFNTIEGVDECLSAMETLAKHNIGVDAFTVYIS